MVLEGAVTTPPSTMILWLYLPISTPYYSPVALIDVYPTAPLRSKKSEKFADMFVKAEMRMPPFTKKENPSVDLTHKL